MLTLVNMDVLIKMISLMTISLALISSTGLDISLQLTVKLSPATMNKGTLIAYKFLPPLILKVNFPCQESETEFTGRVFLTNVVELTLKSSQLATADLTTTFYSYSSINIT